MTFHDIMDWLLGPAIGAGLALLAIKAMGAKALDWLLSRHASMVKQRYDTALEDIKARNLKELENLRSSLHGIVDRAIKRNQREFDIVPEAWTLLHKSYWSAKASIPNAAICRHDTDEWAATYRVHS